MRNLSLLPDPWNAWAYDYSNKELYNSPEAQDLREQRWQALRALPEWLCRIGLENDNDRRNAAASNRK